METATSAKEVAKYLLWLAAHECVDDPDYLTPLKLQKLLYYVQGWSLVEWNRPMFYENIEAWRDGPVVPEVQAEYAGMEKSPLVESPSDDELTLSPLERAMVRNVWNAYKEHSGYRLHEMTHKEMPWLETYKPQNRDRQCSKPIKRELLERCFREKAEAAIYRLPSRRERLRQFAEANTLRLVGRKVI